MSKMRFTSQVAWTFATRLLMIFNSVAAGIIVAHRWGAEGVGRLAVVNVAVATVVQLCSFGLPSSNTYFIAKDQQRFRAAALNALIFALAANRASMTSLRSAVAANEAASADARGLAGDPALWQRRCPGRPRSTTCISI